MPRRTDLIVIIALAVAANFAYLAASNGDYFFPDSATYLGPAHNLLAGRGFVNVDGRAETMRTPGYPLLLAVFGIVSWSAVPVLVLQHLLNVAIAVALYLLAMRRLRSPFVALTSAILFALDPPSLHYANKVLTETLFTALLFVILLLALRRSLLLDGILVGALVLIRPVAILFVVPMAIFFLATRTKRVAVFVIAALVLPIGWGLRNKHETGVFTVASIAGTNMLMHRAAGAMAMEVSESDFKTELADAQQELLDIAEEEIDRTLTDATDSHAARSVIFNRLARRVLREHPRGALLLTLRGLLVNAFDSDADAIVIVSRLHESIVTIALNAVTAMAFAAAMLGLAALWRRDRELAMLFALTIAYYLFISAGAEAEARFRVPVAPLLAFAAACGIEAAFRSAGADAGAPMLSTTRPPST